jgi:hypothetical protein
MSTPPNATPQTSSAWNRIPDGIKVRIGLQGQEGVIDGLTQLVMGARRNPDGRTQYRVNVGEPARVLAVEDELWILTDRDGLVLMGKEQPSYRQHVTERLRGTLAADRFVPAQAPAESPKKRMTSEATP